MNKAPVLQEETVLSDDSYHAAIESKLRNPRKVYSRLSLAVFFYLVATLVSQILLEAGVSLLAPEWLKSPYFVWVVMVVCQYLVAIPVAFLCTLGLPVFRYPAKRLSAGSFMRAFGLCVLISYVGSVLSRIFNAWLEVVTGKTSDDSALSAMMENSSLWVVMLVVGIIGPLMEELLFRKMLLERLRPYGEKPALLYTALIFGLIHGNLSQFFYAFGIGLILGYLYLRTNTLWHGALLHILFNLLFGVMASYLQGKSESGEGWMMAAALLGWLILAMGIVGIVAAVRLRRRVFFLPNYYEIPKGRRFKTVFVNVGSILLAVALLAYSVFAMLI